MKKYIYVLLVLSLCANTIFAQKSYLGSVSFEEKIVKKDNTLLVDMTINISELNIASDEMMILTPMIVSIDGGKVLELAPIVFNGNNRQKAYDRAARFNNAPEFPQKPLAVFSLRDAKKQPVPYQATIPYESWMRKAQLLIKEQITGCASCDKGTANKVLNEKIVKEPFMPEYKLTYITPEAEPVKARSESYAAKFSYKVNSSQLIPDYKDNPRELLAVDKIVREVMGDKNLNVTKIAITGFASPDGRYEKNVSLAKDRAYSFEKYLQNNYGLNKGFCEVKWIGEDWAGFKSFVERSTTIPNKEEVLMIINSTDEYDVKEKKLRALAKKVPYNYILENIFPELRRNEYTIAFVAKAFDVNEAKEVIKTKPQLLSLNEMFLVANTYPKGSKEFKDVFDIASRLFPNDPVAKINAATLDLESGNIDGAIEKLEALKDNPLSWNNLGVAYTKKGRFDEAKSLFKMAKDRGDATSAYNMDQIDKFFADRD